MTTWLYLNSTSSWCWGWCLTNDNPNHIWRCWSPGCIKASLLRVLIDDRWTSPPIQGQGQQSYADNPRVRDKSSGCRWSKLIAHKAIKTTWSTIWGSNRGCFCLLVTKVCTNTHKLKADSQGNSWLRMRNQEGIIIPQILFKSCQHCHYGGDDNVLSAPKDWSDIKIRIPPSGLSQLGGSENQALSCTVLPQWKEMFSFSL
jgi:hypothetical protein